MLLENITLGQMLRRTTERHPDRPALEYLDQVYTYRELDVLVDRYALALMEHGVRKGDHVGILCEAEPNTIILAYAITRIGAVVAMLNTSLMEQELIARLSKSDISYLLIGDGYRAVRYPQVCAGLIDQVAVLKKILYIGLEGNQDYENLVPSQADLSPVYEAEKLVEPQDTAFILFTSGTGSTPKAVMSSHYSRANSGLQQAKDLGATCEDRFCVAMPAFHCFCLSVNVFASCAAGACLYLPASRHTEDLLRAISVGKCSVFSCVPALFQALLRKPNLSEHDLSSLRIGYIGGSSYPVALFLEAEERLGFTLLSSLGQTEATAGITVCYPHDSQEVRSTTIGHFMDHVEGIIMDPTTGKEQPVGVSGEICVRGYILMQGYYGQPEATAAAIDANGWLHTGDVGYLDENGNIHLSGRMKELIIRGGENISPKEIESIFFDDPQVNQCKAVGVPDAFYGEEICLCITTDPANPCDEAHIRSAMDGKLAAYKIPRYVLFMEQMPMTTTGKIRLQELKDIAANILFGK